MVEGEERVSDSDFGTQWCTVEEGHLYNSRDS